MRMTRKKLIAALAAAVLVISLATAAIAYWTTTGSGTSTADSGSDSGVTIIDTTAPTGLVPGGDAQALDFTIHNGATTNQFVNSVAISISSIDAPNATTLLTCTNSDFDLVQPTAISSDLVPGDTAFAPSGATIALKDTSSNQDGCKGATVHLAYNAS